MQLEQHPNLINNNMNDIVREEEGDVNGDGVQIVTEERITKEFYTYQNNNEEQRDENSITNTPEDNNVKGSQPTQS